MSTCPQDELYKATYQQKGKVATILWNARTLVGKVGYALERVVAYTQKIWLSISHLQY